MLNLLYGENIDYPLSIPCVPKSGIVWTGFSKGTVSPVQFFLLEETSYHYTKHSLCSLSVNLNKFTLTKCTFVPLQGGN